MEAPLQKSGSKLTPTHVPSKITPGFLRHILKTARRCRRKMVTGSDDEMMRLSSCGVCLLCKTKRCSCTTPD